MKRVTSGNASQRIPSAFPGTMFSDRLNGILGARGKKTAVVERKNWGNENLVQFYEYDQGESHELSENRSCSSLRREEMESSMDSRIRSLSTGVDRALKRKTTSKCPDWSTGNCRSSSFRCRYDSLIHRRTRLRAAAVRMFLVTENPIRGRIPPLVFAL